MDAAMKAIGVLNKAAETCNMRDIGEADDVLRTAVKESLSMNLAAFALCEQFDIKPTAARAGLCLGVAIGLEAAAIAQSETPLTIAEAAPAPKSEWVPFAERWPDEKTTRYLIHLQDGNIVAELWLSSIKQFCGYETGVTHWMELPAPPPASEIPEPTPLPTSVADSQFAEVDEKDMRF